MNKRLPVLPLRDEGPLVEPHLTRERGEDDPPRALRSLARIVDEGLCHRCGSCVGICPTNVLGLDREDYPTVKNLSACTDCDLCVKVCPGDEFSVPSVARQMFHTMPDIEDMHGFFRQAHISYATDPVIRQGSTSGGLISGILVSLLERGLIDGAVVVGSESEELWKGAPQVARTREAILGAMKSKYAISPTNVALREIAANNGRYALVGLPCQIHGFHKAARLDRRIRDRVVLTIGLFCHAAVEHEPMRYVFEKLGDKKKDAVRFISRIGKHPGTPHLQMADGSLQPVYFPEAKGYRPSSMEILNIFYRLYTPSRCLTCYDSTSEFADLAVGDPWMAPPSSDINFRDGYSFALARTVRAEEVLRDCAAAGAIKVVPITAEHAKSSNRMMGVEKRNRAFRVIETRRRQGHSVPEYGIELPRVRGKHLLPTELNMLSHFFCFVDGGSKLAILRVTFSKVGYALLAANQLRRRFREWRRDTLTMLKYRLRKSGGVQTDAAAEGAAAGEPANRVDPAVVERFNHK